MCSVVHMVHEDHVRLIEKGIRKDSGGIWADFGSGEGAFTLSLRDIAGSEVEIYSIDQEQSALRKQEKNFDEMFPDTNIHFIQANFTDYIDIPYLDGLIAANSIHFEPDTASVFKRLASYLKPNGICIVVEYNVDSGNMWVPHPFSFESFKGFAQQAGLINPKLLSTTPSGFLREIYAAKAEK